MKKRLVRTIISGALALTLLPTLAGMAQATSVDGPGAGGTTPVAPVETGSDKAVASGMLVGSDALAQPAAVTRYCATSLRVGGNGGVITLPLIDPANTVANRICLMNGKQVGTVYNSVSALQLSLRNCYGETRVNVDGRFGVHTEAALVKWQAISGVLTPDGVYGPATHNAIVFWGSGSSHNYCYPDSVRL